MFQGREHISIYIIGKEDQTVHSNVMLWGVILLNEKCVP